MAPKSEDPQRGLARWFELHIRTFVLSHRITGSVTLWTGNDNGLREETSAHKKAVLFTSWNPEGTVMVSGDQVCPTTIISCAKPTSSGRYLNGVASAW